MSHLNRLFGFVSACARIPEYDALLQLLAKSAQDLVDVERICILLCDDNRQISRTIAIENHTAREIGGNEIQLSEMDLILQVLVSGEESSSNTTTCIPMQSAGRIVGVLSLATKNDGLTDPDARFSHFLADYLAGTFDRLEKSGAITTSPVTLKAIADAREASIAATHTVSLRMSYLAQHDGLTDLPNRLLLNDRLARALTLSKRHRKPLAVLFLDLDGFKPINDSLGHATGDQLLRQISDRLVKCVRSSDTVARIGGDEFVILLAELEHTEDALVSVNKILAAVAAPMRVANREVCITLSIGISICPDDGDDAVTLIQKADTAMYRAKAAGTGKWMFYGREKIAKTKEA